MKKIIAKTHYGQEYIYSKKECFAVVANKAKKICDCMNDLQFCLRDGEKWHIYDVAEWELKYMNAGYERLTEKKNGAIVIREYTPV